MRKPITIVILFITFFSFSISVFANNVYNLSEQLEEFPYPPPNPTEGSPSNPNPSEDNNSPIISTPETGGDFSIESVFKLYLPLILLRRPYDRFGAAAYADEWAHGRNSNYPNYGEGCSCNDCTNFVSQALYNGGYPLRSGNWDKNSIFEWWYRKVMWWYENSNTWSATDWFNTYLFQYPNEFELESWPTELVAGDFFLLDLRGANPADPPDGIPDHVRFVVGVGYTSTNQNDYTDGCGTNETIPTSRYKLLIDQHCTDRRHVAWDYNLPGSFGFWSFHVK